MPQSAVGIGTQTEDYDASGAGTQTPVVTTTGAVAAGEIILVFIAARWENSALTSSSLTDSAGNTYTRLGGGGGSGLYYCRDCLALAAGSSITFSYTRSAVGSGYAHNATAIEAIRVSGVPSGWTLAVGSVQNNWNAFTAPTPDAITSNSGINFPVIPSGQKGISVGLSYHIRDTCYANMTGLSFTTTGGYSDIYNKVGPGSSICTVLGMSVASPNGISTDITATASYRTIDGDGSSIFPYTANVTLSVPSATTVFSFMFHVVFYGVAPGSGLDAVLNRSKTLKWVFRADNDAELLLTAYKLDASAGWVQHTEVSLGSGQTTSILALGDDGVSLVWDDAGTVYHCEYYYVQGQIAVQNLGAGAMPSHTIDRYGRRVVAFWDGSAFSYVVGTPLGDGSFDWGDPVSMDLDPAPAEARGSLERLPNNEIEFTYEDENGDLQFARCKPGASTAAWTWG